MFRAVRSGPRIPPCVGLALRPTHPGSHSGPTLRPRVPGGTALALRARTPVLASGPRTPVSVLLSPHSCLRTPASAPRPALRSRVPGGALRSRAPTQTCPHILPRALGGGFEGRILEGGFRVPGSSSGPRVLALCSGPHNPVLAPRLLHSRPAFRAAVLKGGFRATFWNVAFRAAVLKEGVTQRFLCEAPAVCF